MSRPAYTCLDTLAAIKNGTIEFNGVTNETLASTGWLWTGPIARLLKTVPRDSIIAMTYEGCRVLCDHTELNTPNTALVLVTNWVFPLSIIFGLPYDSLHYNRLWGTASAVSNWLGSPQTAMTATMFNFGQIRACHRRAGRGSPETDAYYTLSCFNQFLLPMQDDRSELNEEFTTTLIYGLFRPLRNGPGNEQERNLDIEYTRQLLALLASQLRLLRRRNVVPMMLSLGTFLGAAIISVYLAFGEAGDGIDSTSLTLGLVYTWVPMLVVSSIVDRNPTSTERVRELMSRWLYNVDAVRTWKRQGAKTNSTPKWWCGTKGPSTIQPSTGQPPSERQLSEEQPGAEGPAEEQPIGQPESAELVESDTTEERPSKVETDDDMPDHYIVGDFIGQGRQMDYCGLPDAVLSCIAPNIRVEPEKIDDSSETEPLIHYDTLAQQVRLRLRSRQSRGSKEWWAAAIWASLLVNTPLFMAFTSAFVSPTAGLGCWSGSILFFAVLSSFSWVVSLFNRSPGPKMRIVCHTVNTLALLFLLFFTGLVLSGGTNNCYCNTTWFAYPYSGGYMTFGGFGFVRENYDVVVPCALAATFGFAVALGFFFFEAVWWYSCKHMWKTTEREMIIPPSAPVRVNMDWLQ